MNNRYDFFISASAKSSDYLDYVRKLIINNGLTCFTVDFFKLGDSYMSSIIPAIRSAKAFILLVDQNFIVSQECKMEAELMIRTAKDYDRLVFPIVSKDVDISSVPWLSYYLDTHTIYNSERETLEAAIDYYKDKTLKENLYEQLSEYITYDYTAKIVSTIHEIFNIIVKFLPLLDITRKLTERASKTYLELITLLSTLNKYFICGYSDEDKKIAREVGAIIDEVSVLLDYVHLSNDDKPLLLETSITLTLLSLINELGIEMMDIRTNGDARVTIRAKDRKAGDILYGFYKKLMVLFNVKDYTIEEIEIIKNVDKLTFFSDKPSNKQKASSTGVERDSGVNQQLYAIANYINESNKLFEQISDKNMTYGFLICLKTSYERLKNYSDLVGCKEICALCIEKLSEINHRLESLSSENQEDDNEKENSFKALLGFALPNNNEYDVFISYKHEDEDLAGNLYRFTKSNLLNAFYDKVTLPILGKSEYHDAIMDALDKSKNFVLVISDLEYLKSHWVDLEMKTFNKELDEGRKPDGNFIIVVTPDLFETIIKTNKKCLPIQYRGYEIMMTTNYRERLIPYLKKNN